jgi:hypothetical protein
VALQLGVHVRAAEDIEQPPLGMAREADQAAREFGQLIECGRAFALRSGPGHLFRHRSAFEETETGACVQFYVHGSGYSL